MSDILPEVLRGSVEDVVRTFRIPNELMGDGLKNDTMAIRARAAVRKMRERGVLPELVLLFQQKAAEELGGVPFDYEPARFDDRQSDAMLVAEKLMEVRNQGVRLVNPLTRIVVEETVGASQPKGKTVIEQAQDRNGPWYAVPPGKSATMRYVRLKKVSGGSVDINEDSMLVEVPDQLTFDQDAFAVKAMKRATARPVAKLSQVQKLPEKKTRRITLRRED